MKGVTYIRVKLRARAECQQLACGWVHQASLAVTAADVRQAAERHVKDSGHLVDVTIRDITSYSPEVTA